jgi:hypothetical protein
MFVLADSEEWTWLGYSPLVKAHVKDVQNIIYAVYVILLYELAALLYNYT